MLFVGAASAQGVRMPLPSRDEKPEKTDRRCAAEGPGFVYSPEARTCVRLAGLVGIQAGGAQRPR